MPTTHLRRIPIRDDYFNPHAILLYGLLPGEVKATLEDTREFVHSLNTMLYRKRVSASKIF